MTEKSEHRKTDSNLSQVFLRLTRAQFLPLVMLPALGGAAFAYNEYHYLNYPFLALTLIGVILLHLGANAIDDCYDFQNGVDSIANTMFPPDFGGWKPLPRGMISLKSAKFVSYLLFVGSLSIAALLWLFVGPWSFVFGFTGVLLAIFYTAPPLKLDYRGLGLGELSILFAFGPIPVLGAYYVQTGSLSIDAFLLSLPIGLMTVTILLDHDLIFYDVYRKANKYSLATVLGKRNTLILSMALSLVSYSIIVGLAFAEVIPIWSLAAPVASLALLLRKRTTFVRPNEPPPFYVSFTENGLASNWVFGLILVISLLI